MLGQRTLGDIVAGTPGLKRLVIDLSQNNLDFESRKVLLESMAMEVISRGASVLEFENGLKELHSGRFIKRRDLWGAARELAADREFGADCLFLRSQVLSIMKGMGR